MVGAFAQPVSVLFYLLPGNPCISLKLTDIFLQYIQLCPPMELSQ